MTPTEKIFRLVASRRTRMRWNPRAARTAADVGRWIPASLRTRAVRLGHVPAGPDAGGRWRSRRSASRACRYTYVRYRGELAQIGPDPPAVVRRSPARTRRPGRGPGPGPDGLGRPGQGRDPHAARDAPRRQGERRQAGGGAGAPARSRDSKDSPGTSQGILERELVRQAILIAARDELGLATRDELLDDDPPGKGEGQPIEIALLFRPGECHALVRRGEGEKAEILFQNGPRHQPGPRSSTWPSSPRWPSRWPDPSSPPC